MTAKPIGARKCPSEEGAVCPTRKMLDGRDRRVSWSEVFEWEEQGGEVAAGSCGVGGVTELSRCLWREE